MYQLSIVWNSQFSAEMEMCLQPCGWVEVEVVDRIGWKIGLVWERERFVRTGHHKAEIFLMEFWRI